MTISLKHAFQSAKSDGVDNTLIQPSNWNEEHELTLATGKVLGRYSAGTGAAQELTPSGGITIDGSGNLKISTVPTASLSGDYDDIGSLTLSGTFRMYDSGDYYGAVASAIYGENEAKSTLVVSRWGNTAFPPRIVLAKSRGASIGTHANVQTDDQLGDISWYGDDNSSFGDPTSNISVRIRVEANENFSSIAHGARFSIATPDDAGTTLENRFVIDNSDIQLNGAVTGLTSLVTGRVSNQTIASDVTDGTTSTPTIKAHGTSIASSSGSFVRWNTDSVGGYLTIGKVSKASYGGSLSGTAVANDVHLGELRFAGSDGSTVAYGARIVVKTTEAWDGSGHGCEWYFQNCDNNSDTVSTGLWIKQDGTVVSGGDLITNSGFFFRAGNVNTDDTLYDRTSGSGGNAALINSGGQIQAVQDVAGTPCIAINKANAANATNRLISFYRNGSLIASIYANAADEVQYPDFSGVHYSQYYIAAVFPNMKRGTIVASADALNTYKYVVYKDDDGVERKADYKGKAEVGATVKHKGFTSIVTEEVVNRAKFKVSDEPSDPCVYGIFDGWDDDGDAKIAAVGASVIRIAAGETVKRGDLIESAGDGCGRPQKDNVIRSSTVGKVTAMKVIETYDDGSYIVPVVLYCG